MNSFNIGYFYIVIIVFSIVILDDMFIYIDYNDGSMKLLFVFLNNFILESKKYELNVLILFKIDENYNVEYFLVNDFLLNIKISRI